MANPRSTANIAGHPIHPMLVPFPIALFVAAFVTDIVYWQTGIAGWATASTWLIGMGLLTAAAAAVAGLIDFLADRMVRRISDAWWHAGGNVLVVLIEGYNWFIRYTQGVDVVVPIGLILSLVAAGLLVFTGWKGGEMVFRYRVGVLDSAQQPEARPMESPRRAA